MRTDHAPVDTMEACYEIDSILQAVICKNLFLCNRQKTQFYLLMMPGDKAFKTKEITSQIGSARLSFASAEDMEKYFGVAPLSVIPENESLDDGEEETSQKRKRKKV